jgi:hypothetical protein
MHVVNGVKLKYRPDMSYNWDTEKVHINGWSVMPRPTRPYEKEVDDKYKTATLRYGMTRRFSARGVFHREVYMIWHNSVYRGTEKFHVPPKSYFTECGYTDEEAEEAREIYKKVSAGRVLKHSMWTKQRLRRGGIERLRGMV